MFCYNCMNEKGHNLVCPYCDLDNKMEPSSHHLRPGTLLAGKYTVGYAIGEGGFGITYIGRDMTLDMRVAVKEFFPSGYANRSSAHGGEVSVAPGKQREFFDKGKASFLTEARNVAKFSSEKGIVDVRDYFEENGTAYIIMEYLDGVNLNEYLNTYGVIPAAKAFRMMLPVMRSLEKINDAGIIHRDISPDNIMCLKDGTLKLTDFGAARYYMSEENDMSIMLKQGYAPEEQYRRNGRQGPWTDVYGLSATLYRMITGKIPVSAPDRMYNDELLPPSRMGIEISRSLESVLMYGLAVYKENRCRSMAEFISLTLKALSDQPMNIRTAPATRSYGDGFSDTTVSPDPTKEQKPNPQQPTQEQQNKKKKNTTLLIVIIVTAAAVFGIIIGMFFLLRGGGSNTDPTQAQKAAETIAATEEPTEAPTEIPEIVLKGVVGLKVDRAVNILEEQGLQVDIDYISDDSNPNYVIKQSPEPNTVMHPGDHVTIYLPEAKPTEAPTEPPTEPEDLTTYVNISDHDIWIHTEASRLSDVYETVIPSSAKVEYLGVNSGDFKFIRYNDIDGWVLSRLLCLHKDAESVETIKDEEYHDTVACKIDTYLYDSPEMVNPITITAGEEAVLIGYCANKGNGYYELWYNNEIYYLAESTFKGSFEKMSEEQ